MKQPDPKATITPEVATTMGNAERTANLEIASDALFREHENLLQRGIPRDPRTIRAYRLIRQVIEERKALLRETKR